MTGVLNVGAVATHPPTAHLPGLGPDGATCATCVHFVAASRRHRGRCWKWAHFRGLAYRFIEAYRADHDDWWAGLRTIPRKTPACKYWMAKP